MKDKSEGHKSRTHVVNSLLAGSIAGMVAKTMVAPVDRVKIIYQSTSKPFTFKRGLQTVNKICKYSGWRGLWRGNTATMLRVAPYSAIQFSVHEQLKTLFEVRTYEQKLKKPFLSFLAGGCAGLVAITLTYPLDVARARMATDHSYKSIYDVMKRAVLSKDPKLSLYRGYAPAICGLVPYTGASFLIYELFKTRYFAQVQASTKNRLSLAAENIVMGAIVSFIGQTIIFPLDVLRRKMQTNVMDDSTMGELTLHILKTEGPRGMFKGISLSWFKLPIVMGASMATFDFFYYNLNKINK